jgi:hemolysin activation/secretion protein
MLYRTQRVKTALTMRLAQTASHSFLNDTEIDVQRRNETYGELVLDRSANDGRNNSLDVAMGLRAGLPLLGALPDLQVRGAPTSLYTMGTFDVSGSVPFRVGKLLLRWAPHVHAQVTNDPLYITDDFSIGNRYTVRGFDGTQSIAAESGYFWRNDFEHPISEHTAIYGGLDTGSVWGPAAQFQVGHAIAGAAIGVRGGRGRMTYDVFTGVPIQNSARIHTAATAGGVDFTYQF